MTTHWLRRMLGLLFALTLLATACSSDDDGGDESADTDDASEEAPADGDTDDASDDASEEAPAEGEADEAAGDAVAVELGEWFVGTEATQPSGSVTFAISNVGENPHAFAIVRGDSYENLPQLENGAVDLDAVGDDLLGSTENIESGGSDEITFELEAGNYVFFCPIQFGPNSHAAAGQVLSVTVG